MSDAYVLLDITLLLTAFIIGLQTIHSTIAMMVLRIFYICFDFRNNQFHELRGPTFSVEDRKFLRDDVAEIKGSLAYVVQHHFDSPVVSNIWVMDQSGWHKKYNIIGPPVSMSRMLGLWKNGDELLGGKFGEPLKSYDHQGNSLCQFQIDFHKTKY
ncbi:hypothetical protein MtrunA17_Chr1g0156391 [Medicago truncatula]|uniref:Transmembrane protein, putative n=1 Tax=Medicago truncatula TaxID=3880 RepID=A0A072VDX2_MEDTR|nr:transmembrane protein, putative [Medicago truncatula]RHN77587.1 hypothetical protein MtrunA17_Chr1g0156391 [Medicago truncatula]